MSSIRLFILGSLAQHGEMHGHQLRLLAEEEHVALWTDISVGSLYGAIKRLASEGLIDVVRVEREGNFPERQIYAISQAGLRVLTTMRRDELSNFLLKPDPFDLALTRLDPDRLDDLPSVIEGRVLALKLALREVARLNAGALPYLSVAEKFALNHREHRLQAEIAWHEQLVAAVPEIIADEVRRREAGHTDRTDGTDRTDRTDRTDPSDPTDRTDRTDPSDPSDRTDPTDPSARKAPTHV